jgi:hypothetical protein
MVPEILLGRKTALGARQAKGTCRLSLDIPANGSYNSIYVVLMHLADAKSQ